MGKSYRLVKPQLTMQDIIDVRKNADVSLTTSPFGITPEQYATNPPIYVKKAVNWKGRGGMGIAGFERAVLNEGLCTDDIKGRNLINGLKKAIEISKKAAGTRGTELYNGKLYPRKCIEQKRIAGKM